MKLNWRWETQFCVADIGDFANVFVLPHAQYKMAVYTFHINLREDDTWRRIWDSEWFQTWDAAQAAAEELIDSKVVGKTELAEANPTEVQRRTVRALVSVCD